MYIKNLFGSVCLIFLVGSALGQTTPFDRRQLNSAAFYGFAESGDVTIQVHVWGAVSFPGLYEVPRDTKLSTLISLGGGPLMGERINRARRHMTVKLYRFNGVDHEVIFESATENKILELQDDPILMPNDILSFESVVSQRFSWRDIFSVVSTAATLVLLIDRVNSVN